MYASYLLCGTELHLGDIRPCFYILESFGIRFKYPYTVIIEHIYILEIRRCNDFWRIFSFSYSVFTGYFIESESTLGVSLYCHDSPYLPTITYYIKSTVYMHFLNMRYNYRKDRAFLRISIYSGFVFIYLPFLSICEVYISIEYIDSFGFFPCFLSSDIEIAYICIFTRGYDAVIFRKCEE